MTQTPISTILDTFMEEGIKLTPIGATLLGVPGLDDQLDDLSMAGNTKRSDISLGITHVPYERVLAAMAQDKLDLILAGHTHGGQVRLPWFGGSKALTTNCDLENWRASGLSKVNDEPWLNVSAGMGYSPYAPIRLFCPPEISLITLTA